MERQPLVISGHKRKERIDNYKIQASQLQKVDRQSESQH